MSMVNTKRKFLEVPLLSTIRKLVQLSILLVQSRALFSKQTKESKLSLQDSVLSKVVSIMDQSTRFGEIQDTQNISSQSEIGLLRFGVKISDPQLCRLDITLPTSLMVAGPQLDVVYSSSLELMVSSMFGISTIDKMRLHTVKRSVTLHLHLLWSTKISPPLVTLKVLSLLCSYVSHYMRLTQRKKNKCKLSSRENSEEKRTWRISENRLTKVRVMIPREVHLREAKLRRLLIQKQWPERKSRQCKKKLIS
jgi:hypothetical protein